MTSTEMLSTI